MKEKMTILYVCQDPSTGGSTRSLMNLIEATSNEVIPIVLLPSKGFAYNWFMSHGVECIVHRYLGLQMQQDLDWKYLLRYPWKTHIIKYVRHEWTCVFYVLRQLNGRKIHIVHSNTSPTIIGRKLAFFLHAKHVWHIREFIDLDFNQRVFGGRKMLQQMLNQADARISISEAIKKHWHLKEENTWVLANPICKKKESEYVREKDKYVLFCSGLIHEFKGAEDAVRAFGMSGISKHGFVLKMVGKISEGYKDYLLQVADQYEDRCNVEFIPNQADVKPLFARAVAFIMASKCEAFGRTTAEAMFWGCPVIAHATGGTIDFVKHNKTGYLYDSIEECAELIERVCTEDQEPIILRAQAFAINNLSQEVYGPKILTIYREIL